VPLPAGRTESEFTETNLREVRYPSLAAGHYTFEVSCGSAQLGQSPLAAYSFDVLAPWWQTWWAQAIDVFVSALLLLGCTGRGSGETGASESAWSEPSLSAAPNWRRQIKNWKKLR